MKNIVAIGASNSRKSINQQLAQWAANQVGTAEVNTLDLNDFEMPIYSIDREQETGIPQQAIDFKEAVKSADGVVISFAEHNGSYSAAFKNITDWVSRIERGTWANKPVLLLATSPGARGGQGVLSAATATFPHQGAQVTGSFSLPSFGQNFTSEAGITEEVLRSKFNENLADFKKSITEAETATAEA